MPSTVVEDLAQGQPFTDVGPAVVPSRKVTPGLTPEEKKAFTDKGIPLPPPLPGEQAADTAAAAAKPADPFASEKLVAHADPFAGESQVGADPFAGERQADELDLRSPQDLAADPKFKIHDFIFQNKENIFSDPKRYQRALDTYREAQQQGATLKKTVASVKEGTGPLLLDILKSVPKRLENISDIAVAPAVNALVAKLSGADRETRDKWEDMSDDDRQKAVAEAVAGTQTAVGSLQDMVRQGARKLVGPAFTLGGKKSWKDISDDELKGELFKDLGWRETVEGLSRGEGVKELTDQGVTLDPENIKLLSLTDPITLVATGGGLKAVSTGGRMLFTAANEAGANAALSWLGKQASTAAAKGAELAGKGAEVVGKGISNVAHVPSVTVAGVASGHAVQSLAAAAAAKGLGKMIEVGGRVLKEAGQAAGGGATEGKQLLLGLQDTAGSKILNAAKTVSAIATPPVAGAVKGAAAAAPLAFATDEPQGGLLGVGAVLGGVHGTVSGVKGAVAEAGAKRYFDPGQINWEKTESPGYDNFSTLNQAHEQAAAAAPENTRNMVDSLRETLRPFGRKLFLVDDATYRKALENDTLRENGGQPLTAEQQAALDQEAKTRGISKIFVADDAGAGEMVTLVRSSEAAPHEFSHVLESVMTPDARKALHEAVQKNYSDAELQTLRKHYEQQTGRKMTADDVESEFLADNWANLLYNTPLENLGLPEPKPGLRETLLRGAMSLGEQLGIDLSAGRVTPGLELRPSFNLRKALVNATGELLSERNRRVAQGQAKTAPAPQPAPEPATITPEEVKPAAPAAQGELNLGPVTAKTAEPAPVVEPAAQPEAVPATPVPAARPPTARNIRVTPEQQSDLAAAKAATTNKDLPTTWAAKQTPESQATVATINKALDEGGAVRIVHSGAEAAGHAAGETVRAAEVEAGRGRTEGELHSKDLFPTRWEKIKSGEPVLVARSVDKVLANVDRAVPMMKAAGEKLPWATDAEGNLTAQGRSDMLADLKTYWLNQDAGHRGGGGLFIRPEEVGKTLGESLPERKGEGVPLDVDPATNDAKEQFLNLVQGKDLGPPETVREVKGQKPKNILAQELQVLQNIPGRTPEPVTGLPVRAFKSGGEIKEVNPLRNRLRAAKQPVNELETITERVKASDITSAAHRPELPGRGGSTDITRGGFLTDRPVNQAVEDVFKMTGDEWMANFAAPKESLTKTAYRLGLGLKSADELAAIKAAETRASAEYATLLEKAKSGDMDALDAAYPLATKSQFFREAYEAATDTKSAAGPAGWRRSFPEAKPPFAEPASRGGFLTEAKQEEPKTFDPIKQASIRTKGGQVFTGSWHGEALDNFYEAARKGEVKDLPANTNLTDTDPSSLYSSGYLTDGFNTQSGKFLNREQALEHSVKIGQFKPAERGNVDRTGALESNEFTGRRAFLPEKELSKIREGEKEGETFNSDGSIFVPKKGEKLDVVTLASINLPVDQLTEANVAKALEPYREVLGQENIKAGVFKLSAPDAEGKPQVSVDVNAVVDQAHREASVAFARANNQEAIFDLDKFETVPTGGTGDTVLKSPAEISKAAKALQEGKNYLKSLASEVETQVKSSEKGLYLPVKKKVAAEEKGLSGWMLPNQQFRAVGGMFGANHENFLEAKGPELNKKFGTTFGEKVGADDRLHALNKGFVRMREYNGNVSVELNSKYWNGRVKSAILNKVQDNVDDVNTLRVTLLDDKGETIDSHSENLFMADDPFDAAKTVVDSVRTTGSKRGGYLPEAGTPEFNKYVEERIEESKQHPEALPLEFRKDEAGNYKGGFNGEPVPVAQDYNLMGTPMAKKAKGKTAAEKEDNFTSALAADLKKQYAEAKKNPDVEAGETWYSTCREKLQTLLGDDTKFFAELLGATSAQTNVDANFGFALDAYNQFKAGKFDATLAKYREGKNAFANGELEEFSKDTGKTGKKATYDAFMNWWIDKHDLTPTQSNGKRFGMNSKAVLRVLDGSWLQQVKGPKTPNFTGNLTGSTFEATIDVWAMRLLHRLANVGKKQWRIQPANETGVTDTDFFIGQKAFRKAADDLGVQPDALQAILWFAEKDHWEKAGWTKSVGKKKSDYNVLLQQTEKSPEGQLRKIDKQPRLGNL